MTNKEIKLVKVTKLNLNFLYNFVINKKIMGNFQNIYQKTFRNFLEDYRNRKYFLIKTADKKVIGFMYYKLEKRFNAFEIGGAIIPEKRNYGYGYVAHEKLINLLINKNKRRRIQAITCIDNKNEIRILKKCGLVIEGKLKKAGRIGNKLYDLVILSVYRKTKKG